MPGRKGKNWEKSWRGARDPGKGGAHASDERPESKENLRRRVKNLGRQEKFNPKPCGKWRWPQPQKELNGKVKQSHLALRSLKYVVLIDNVFHLFCGGWGP